MILKPIKFLFIPFLLLAGFLALKAQLSPNQTLTQENISLTASVEEKLDKQSESEASLPESFETDIPFIVQAPLADWGKPFNNACEEASILMAHKYFSKEETLPEKSQTEILAMVDFEKKNYPTADLSAAKQTAIFIKDYYGYEAEVYYDITLDDIKSEMVRGNMVILPTAGQRLKNPYFKTPGPPYHMLIVKGYTPTEFIVNDPGTKRGSDFKYSYEILKDAISDWDLKDWDTAINLNGKKAMIVVRNKNL